ncbi:hypothetical protein QQS21_011834 [Conoideocrella luteorostrata]|uniref:WSC domain-containing protein n=1 Tax=Conoideocrella luteorostrata TaxID=1105319 RepID=A0AAJ0CCN1_9HYPO|nr:hypothetical protein QQS21_011834 [Conoideocrella luteorostrata]
MQSAVLRLALTAVHLSFGFAQVSSLTNVERDIMHYDNFGCGKQDVVKAAFRSVAHFGKDNIFPEICGAICHEPFVGIYKGECYCAEKIDVKSFEIGTTNCPPDQVTIFKSLDADKQDNRTDNINGTNIINGTSGTNGTNVVNGTGGTNGTNVVNGTSGTNGTNIVNGTSSTNGANIVNATHSTKAPGVINGTNSTNGVKEPQNTAQVNKGDANQNDNDNNDYVGAATENRSAKTSIVTDWSTVPEMNATSTSAKRTNATRKLCVLVELAKRKSATMMNA